MNGSALVFKHLQNSGFGSNKVDGDGSDTSSIETDKDTAFLDTQKQVVAVRPTQFSNYRSGGDADSDLFQAMNPYFKIGRKP